MLSVSGKRVSVLPRFFLEGVGLNAGMSANTTEARLGIDCGSPVTFSGDTMLFFSGMGI